MIAKRIALPLAVAMLVFGCSSPLPDRLNHFHDDANQEHAEKANALFAEFTDDASGLTAVLLENLGSRMGLQIAVAQKEIEVVDKAEVADLMASTWDTIWIATIKSLAVDEADLSNGDRRLALALAKSDPPIAEDLRRSIAIYLAHRFALDQARSSLTSIPQPLRDEIESRIASVLSVRLEGVQSKLDEAVKTRLEIIDQPGTVIDKVDLTRAFEATLGTTSTNEADGIRRFDELFELSTEERQRLDAKLVDAASLLAQDSTIPRTTITKLSAISVIASVELVDWVNRNAQVSPETLIAGRRGDASKVLARIDRRLALIDGLSKIFIALAEGQRLLAMDAEDGVKRAKAAMQNAAGGATGVPTSSPSLPSEKTRSEFLLALNELREALRTAARNIVEESKSRSDANDLAASIIRAAEESRDPAGIYALVAMIGVGFSEQETALCGLVNSLCMRLRRIGSTLMAKNPRYDEFRNALEAAESACTLCEKEMAERSERGSADAAFVEPETPRLLQKDAPDGVGTAAARVSETLRNIEAIDALAPLASGLPIDITRTATPLIAGDPTGAAVDIADQLLSTRSDEILATEYTKSDGTTTTVKAFLEGLIKDIRSQDRDAKTRLAEYVLELAHTRLQLEQENLRHYSILLSIARDEVARWAHLGAEVRRLVSRMGYSPRTNAKPDAEAVLFASLGTIAKWYEAHGEPQAIELTHAPIERTHSVAGSLRLVAQTAKKWQLAPDDDLVPKKGERTVDTWQHVHRSNRRLLDAVEIIDSSLTIRSLNRRLAALNGVRLLREISEHDILLDGVIARTKEAEIREALRDLVAFHRTGITNDDIRGVIAAVQAAFIVLLEIDS